ncbi:MAG: D-arabinose 1-dehydrogenase-like Zn-dependent alcohol dehydrogenase [Candidatus Nitrosomirales archaeon]|jgi:D-arabinose 1-dehydrogenase-like Zn-dependent alcohol dehydrogenase
MVRAARFHKTGEPLKIEELPKPKVGANDVLLKVKAAGMCHSDIHVIDGVVSARSPVTLGHEIAGEVEEVGANVTQFKKGDRSLVHFLSPCGSCKYCLEGRGMVCENLFTRPGYGFSADGGYAEYCKVDADRLVPVPEQVPLDFAATLGCAGITSYHAVNSVGKVSVTDNVAIYGVGGVGMYALQIAKLCGANVIAIGRNQEKLKMAESLGADYVVDVSKSKLRDEIKKATNGKGVDVMIDFVVNDESVKNSSSSLANGGRIILVGVSNKPLSINPQVFVLREFSLAGSLVGTKNELAELVELARTKRLQSIVTKKFTLDQINDALGSLRKGEIVGRGYVSIQ